MTDVRPIDLALHVPRMRRVALRLLGNSGEADDAVQEACLKAVRTSSSFDGRSQPATWLHKIVTRCALDRIRLRQRDLRRAGSALDGHLAGVLDYAADGPFEQAQQNELRTIIATAVEALPDDCREAFALTQLDGYSYDEAACIQGQPRGTVASRVHRAKEILFARLRERLKGGFGND
jgi:RNA polymerase sigma-70 factor, ECF subfamily